MTGRLSASGHPLLVLAIATWAMIMLATPTGLRAQNKTNDVQNEPAPKARPTIQPSDARLAPYASDPNHLWNRLHRVLFVRTAPDGSAHIHSTDPLLYGGGTFLLEGERHRRAVALLDQLLAEPENQSVIDALRRLVFQHDLWAAFDYLAWYPDDWVFHSWHEPAAIALRTRLSNVISRLALSEREFDALPDNYEQAVKSKQFAATHDPEHSERPFLPTELFQPDGSWVRFHETTANPMATRHFEGAGGRAVHIIFLRLPGGRRATQRYLRDLRGDSVKQFPPGTMTAMVRRALAVDRSAKVRVTSLTELVQLRVYRRIPADRRSNHQVHFGEQDMYEFVLDRGVLFAGQPGLRAVGPDDSAEPFERSAGDPFERTNRRPVDRQLKTCIACHHAPGVHSINSMERGLREGSGETFRTYDLAVETNFTVATKVKQFNWDLLRGMLEARRADGAARPEKQPAR